LRRQEFALPGEESRVATGRPSRKTSVLKAPAQPNRSLVGGLECLDYLVAAEAPVGSREIAREMNLEHTRANRLLGTLAFMGLAERTGGRKYVPGPALHVLAAMSLRGSRLLSVALAPLEKLAARLPEFSVALGVLWRRQVVYLYFRRPGRSAEVAIGGERLFPAEQSSIGQVLLAERSPQEIGKLYADRPAREVRAILRGVRAATRQAYALVDGRSLGVAVGSPAVAGLAIAGEVQRSELRKLVAMIGGTAAAIAAALAAGSVSEEGEP
jgi:DNA-binding IclR family transcriptional regulator